MLTCGGREVVFGGRASGRPAACRGGAGRRPASHGRPGRGRLRAEPAQAAGRRATAEVGRAAAGRGRPSGRRAAGGGRTRAAALAHPSLAEDGVAEIRGDGRAYGGERPALGRGKASRGAGQAEMQRMRWRLGRPTWMHIRAPARSTAIQPCFAGLWIDPFSSARIAPVIQRVTWVDPASTSSSASLLGPLPVRP